TSAGSARQNWIPNASILVAVGNVVLPRRRLFANRQQLEAIHGRTAPLRVLEDAAHRHPWHTGEIHRGAAGVLDRLFHDPEGAVDVLAGVAGAEADMAPRRVRRIGVERTARPTERLALLVQGDDSRVVVDAVDDIEGHRTVGELDCR